MSWAAYLLYLSWPAARRFTSECAARIQNLSCSRLKVCTPVRFDMSHTRMLLSSELETMISCMQGTSQQLLSVALHNLQCVLLCIPSDVHLFWSSNKMTKET